MASTSLNKYAYYLRDMNRIGIVKWDISENRWVTPNETVTDGLYFVYTARADVDASTLAELDTETQWKVPVSLNLALVYYAKAWSYRESGDLEQAEYYMRLFRRAASRAQNNNIGGFRRMSSGMHAIR